MGWLCASLSGCQRFTCHTSAAVTFYALLIFQNSKENSIGVKCYKWMRQVFDWRYCLLKLYRGKPLFVMCHRSFFRDVYLDFRSFYLRAADILMMAAASKRRSAWVLAVRKGLESSLKRSSATEDAGDGLAATVLFAVLHSKPQYFLLSVVVLRIFCCSSECFRSN